MKFECIVMSFIQYVTQYNILQSPTINLLDKGGNVPHLDQSILSNGEQPITRFIQIHIDNGMLRVVKTSQRRPSVKKRKENVKILPGKFKKNHTRNCEVPQRTAHRPGHQTQIPWPVCESLQRCTYHKRPARNAGNGAAAFPIDVGPSWSEHSKKMVACTTDSYSILSIQESVNKGFCEKKNSNEIIEIDLFARRCHVPSDEN